MFGVQYTDTKSKLLRCKHSTCEVFWSYIIHPLFFCKDVGFFCQIEAKNPLAVLIFVIIRKNVYHVCCPAIIPLSSII